MASKPTTMNTIIANTLMDANQNSDSPYSLTDRILSMNTTAMKAADQIHAGESGNQRCISRPAAVNSEASATAQFSQYSTAMVNAVPGPMKRFAYRWKLPAYGMATDSSPRLSITKYTSMDPMPYAMIAPRGPAW